MAKVKFKGNVVNTNGELPKIGSEAPNFKAVKSDMSEFSLSDLRGKRVVINVFPSLDTRVCAIAMHKFNQIASSLPNTVIVALSKDLPFAQKRFCIAENINEVTPLSAFRNTCFEERYGMLLTDGHLKGLLARGVIIVDEKGKIIYTELVDEISDEPDYDAALAALK